MSLHSWLQKIRSALAPGQDQRDHRRRASLRARAHRPSLEVLEDRSVPASSVWGDFNNDALPDLATANYLSNDVSIFLGTSDGPFQPAQNYPTYADGGPTCIAAGDFNGDGNLDLVTGNVDGSISMLRGNGDGSFSVSTFRYTWHTPLALAVGDFNGDGNLDVAVSVSGDTEVEYAGVDVMLGSGNGMLGHILSIPIAGGYATDIEAADLNGDGNLDLWAYNENYGSVTILLGNGDGTFQDAQDVSPPSLGINSVTVVEGNTGAVAATFVVTLSKASTETVTVAYATADSGATAGSDYQAASGTLAFAPGETEKTITVLVNGDRLVEPTEYFVVILSDPTNANIIGTTGGTGGGRILDDEPTVSVSDAAITEGNTGTRSATFTVTLSSISEVDVTVHYDTADEEVRELAGSDYVSASGVVTIPAGQTSATFVVAILGDRLVEANESFAVDLSAPTNAAIADGRGIGTILDDEPRISISDSTKREGRKNTTSFTFTVTLSAAYDQPVTVSYRTADGTATTGDGDYIARTGTLTFAPGETTKTVTIEVKGDSRKEATEYFYLDLSDNSSNSLFTKNRSLGTILNDD